jgi:CHAD domain-containing protein
MKSSGFTMTPAEPVHAWVARTVTGLIDPVLLRTRQPRRDSTETAHLIRVATKQLRALLRLLRPAVSAPVFKREDARLKAAAGFLASGRDRTVARETLTLLIEASEGHRREMLTRLKKDPALSTLSTPDKGTARTISKAVRTLQESGLALVRLPVSGDAWDAIRHGLTKAYRRARSRMKKALDHPAEEPFHRWRIAVKQLYYQLQWLEPVWPERFSRMIRKLHRIEKKLGSDHDLAILRGLLLPPPGVLADPAAISELERAAAIHSRHLRRDAGRCGRKLFDDPARTFAKQYRRHELRWREDRG